LPNLRAKKWWLLSVLLVGGACVGVKITRSRLRCPRGPVSIYAYRLPSGAIFLAEDPHHPLLQKYQEHEHLVDVIRPYKTDFDQILALAKWASVQFKAGSPFPNYPPWNGEEILQRIRHGKTGGFCAQYAFVFGQACQSVGYMPRYVDLAARDDPSGHFTTEVYVPSLKKWVVFESEWGIYYTDSAGHPLNAFELHEWATGKRRDPLLERPTTVHSVAEWSHLFYYFRYYLRNNFLSVPVFVDRSQGQLGFEPYRIIWKDAYTSDPAHLADAIASNDPHDFEFALKTDSIPEFEWKKDGDVYQGLTQEPVFQLCKFVMPANQLTRLVKRDFVHNAVYHRLKS